MDSPLSTSAGILPSLSIAAAAARAWDVVVVGAGPAGSLAARALALAGRSVLLLDRAAFPRDKVCGGCLNATALGTLESVGLGEVVGASAAPALARMVLRAGGNEAVLPVRGRSLSRRVLDAALVREAVRVGVEFLSRSAAHVGLDGGAPRLTIRQASGGDALSMHPRSNVPVRASLVLVCDGVGGSAANEPPLGPRIERGSLIGVAARLPVPHEVGAIQMACGRGGYVGTVGLEDGSTNLAAALDPGVVRAHAGPAGAIGQILREAGGRVTLPLGSVRWHGTPPLTRRRAALFRPGVLFLGDAAGYIEPFTGEGMAWAMTGAVLAADLIVRGRAELWPSEHARRIAVRQRVCRVVASVLRRPCLASLAVRLLSVWPDAAAPLTRAVHRPLVGAIP